MFPVAPELIEISGKISDLDDVDAAEIDDEIYKTVQERESAPYACIQHEVPTALEGAETVEDIVCEVEEAVSSDLVESSAEDMVGDLNPVESAPVVEVSGGVAANSGLGRPRREQSKPAWMRSGDYELDM